MKESDCFKTDNGMRQVYVMTPWLFNEYMNVIMKMGLGRKVEDSSQQTHGLVC